MRLRAHQHRGPAERDADDPDALARHGAAQERERGPRVDALEIPEGDALPAALPVRARVEEEHRGAGGVEEAGAPQHVEAAGAHAVEEQHRARPATAGHEPALEGARGGTEHAHRAPGQIRRELADLPRRPQQPDRRQPSSRRGAGEQEQRGDEAEAPGYFSSPA